MRENETFGNNAQTKSILFGSRKPLDNAAALNLYIDGVQVQQVSEAKLLGVIRLITVYCSRELQFQDVLLLFHH